MAREEGPRGGRVWEEEGSRRGVDVVEFWVEGGRTRLARRKVKNAVSGNGGQYDCFLEIRYKIQGIIESFFAYNFWI